VLNDIFTGLTDENENIKAASIIFLSEFSLNYSDKDMLYKQVEKVKAYSLRTQYEHIRALAMLSNSETKIDKNLIETYLDSKSWLVANMTYLFLGKISCEEFHKDLISKYNNTDKEYNKLLILNAFSNAYNPESFLFIKNEILTSSSKKIKQKAIGILNKNNDKTQVAKWILNEHKTIDKTTLQAIFNEYYSQLESNTGTIFFDTLIISNKKELINKIDQNKFFAALYLAQEKQPKQNNLLNLEVKVQNSTLLNRAWMDFLDLMDEKELKKQEKKEREQEFEKTILPQYKVMLDVFHEDTKKLFLDAGMDKDEVEVFTKEIKELLQLLNKEKSK
ncbi:MAG: hypothetical protein GY707_18720, partial [Desulfobacteraceae bacterium]|nr:hypothetical protein [Desulfobacteraceae bacterium]